jgi:hypothetical protein
LESFFSSIIAFFLSTKKQARETRNVSQACANTALNHYQMDTKQGELNFCARIIMHMLHMYIIPIIMLLFT